MDYQKFFEMKHIECQKGLKEEEILRIEEIYNIFLAKISAPHFSLQMNKINSPLVIKYQT